ncbi:BLUF domain-containing protein [Kineosporia sp. J2-2]|uniref:BLUF domain-containing protein n=1 Tax=Kineosporia corallincola TaxID=2835133 RepID=A0ABS5TK53_9ACTN|nr:BLUF domain-containing protein [Kineosporia corallincola]MBT0771480.1 BLUF domain-containing protein [Kineosporia corallincola]
MYELIYVSQALVDLSQDEMEKFLGVSRTRNAASGVTGHLLHVHDRPHGTAYFVQMLEGPQDAVQETFGRIRRHMLHTDVRLVHRGTKETRSFQGWQMRLATTTTDTVLAMIAAEPALAHLTGSTLDLLADPFLARTLLMLSAGQHA